MFDPVQFRDLVIKPTLEDLANVLPGADHPAAINLLLGTCWQESRGGTYLQQLGGGPALGVYQIEPATHDDLWENFVAYRRPLEDFLVVEGRSHISQKIRQRMLIDDLRYATIIARLVYYRRSFEWPEPDHIHGLGALWKRWYNTPQGAGTIAEFVHNFPEAAL